MSETGKCKVCGENEPEICLPCKNSESARRHIIFKKRVKKRDNYTCTECGEGDKNCLTVHHDDKKNHPYDIEYARTLCYNCHLGKLHKIKRDDI